MARILPLPFPMLREQCTAEQIIELGVSAGSHVTH
jgi:hypothetical protein